MIYRIINTTSGADFGLFEGATPDEAIAAMMADAGCTEEPADCWQAIEVSEVSAAE